MKARALLAAAVVAAGTAAYLRPSSLPSAFRPAPAAAPASTAHVQAAALAPLSPGSDAAAKLAPLQGAAAPAGGSGGAGAKAWKEPPARAPQQPETASSPAMSAAMRLVLGDAGALSALKPADESASGKRAPADGASSQAAGNARHPRHEMMNDEAKPSLWVMVGLEQGDAVYDQLRYASIVADGERKPPADFDESPWGKADPRLYKFAIVGLFDKEHKHSVSFHVDLAGRRTMDITADFDPEGVVSWTLDGHHLGCAVSSYKAGRETSDTAIGLNGSPEDAMVFAIGVGFGKGVGLDSLGSCLAATRYRPAP